ncbi:MAG: chain-length determining protein [Candidatus Accumulibacter sp.]|uniref:Chain-length determining protein n=1 Tax=Candidatus Accumulibacter affinis TaxID=2954384 RepID=A0A935TCQ0_9PROT|nr:chain-length determining protein [Candidatus Accumulibacter affinis]
MERVHQRLAPHIVRRRTLQAALVAIVLAILYWGVVASDRYVSEADVVVDRTDVGSGQSMDFSALLTGGGRSVYDLMLMRDHLRSLDMLQKLDVRLKLRAHYSDWRRDPISRMWSEDTEQEFFHRHYLSRVSIELDDAVGVLRIKAQAYSPEMAQSISSALVEEGERFMNELARRLARDQVDFLEKEVDRMSERLLKARQALVNFQNVKGFISPQAAAESLSTIVARWEGQLTELKAKRETMLGYLSPTAPDIAMIDLEIGSIVKQLQAERGRLTSPKGGTLNRTVEEFQRLEMETVFAQDVYKTALVALEKGRMEATRNLKKVSLVQSPTLPQYPLEPRRIYNMLVFTLSVLVLAGIVQLLAAIIRDHKD